MLDEHQDKGPASIEEQAIAALDWLNFEDPDHKKRWEKFNNLYPRIGRLILRDAHNLFPLSPENQKKYIDHMLDLSEILAYTQTQQ